MTPSITPKTTTKGTAYTKRLTEYPLPAAMMTHELALVNSGKMIVLSQMDDSTLIQLDLDETGRPTNAYSYQIGSATSQLHGVTASSSYSGDVWVTLQNDSQLLRLTPGSSAAEAPTLQAVIDIPKPAMGPHCVSEYGDDLWCSCKNPSDETGDYYVCRINKEDPTNYTLWSVPKSPVFVIKHPVTGDVFASIDTDSKIVRCTPSDGAYFGQSIQTPDVIDIPPTQGSTVVGMCAGPDENIWFVLLGGSGAGTGTFGRVLSDASLEFVTLGGSLGSTAGLLHLTFAPYTEGENYRVYLLSSDITKDADINQPNAVFDVTLDTQTLSITSEVSFVFPTQYSWAHRVLYTDYGLYCTQLETSGLVHIQLDIECSKPVINEGGSDYQQHGIGVPCDTIVYSVD